MRRQQKELKRREKRNQFRFEEEISAKQTQRMSHRSFELENVL